MRAIWSGHITFGLISIPVGLYPAVESAAKVSFHLLHRKDMAPIRYKKFCSVEDKEVSNDEIVKGYEVAKGEYKLVEKEELENLDEAEGDHTIDILQFVDPGSIDPLLFEKSYYVAPQDGGQKAYGVLHAALTEAQRVGIARFRLRTRPLLAALVPGREALSLGTLRTFDDLRSPHSLVTGIPAPKPKELDMARTLVEQLSEKWDPTQHPNEYRKAVQRLLASKPKFTVAQPAKTGEKVVDLMDALRQSLERGGAKSARRKAPRKGRKHAA